MIKIPLIFVFIFFYTNSCNLVFVHIGENLPDYSYMSIYQAKLFNPCSNFYLIISRKAFSQSNKEFLQKLNIKVFLVEDLIKSSGHKLFLYNKRRQDRFWVNTSERIFYLESLSKKLNLVDIFHIENDVLIYFELDENIDLFRSYGNIAAVFDSDNRGILSIAYFKNFKSISYLAQAITQYSKNNYNDMEVLAFLKNNSGVDIVDNLPIVPASYLERNILFNKKGETAIRPYMYINNFNKFNSIFDAAAIGQYLGGIHTDPTPGFINETAFFDPSKFEYVWELDPHQRRIPYIKFNDEKIRINNLHIHSKQLNKFLSKPFEVI